jgi:hypothetical protein
MLLTWGLVVINIGAVRAVRIRGTARSVHAATDQGHPVRVRRGNLTFLNSLVSEMQHNARRAIPLEPGTCHWTYTLRRLRSGPGGPLS